MSLLCRKCRRMKDESDFSKIQSRNFDYDLSANKIIGEANVLLHVMCRDRVGWLVIEPYYQEDGITLYNARCEDVLPQLTERWDLVLTDPPYPNGAGHFEDGIEAARWLFENYECGHWIVFWHELETPPVRLPLVAKHIWHRSNTNRPDNYEAIYEFCADGRKRASRVLSYPVIYPGLTGCMEATGHPTQKNLKLMKRLIEMSGEAGMILDPFAGSGTTLEAAKHLQRKAVGIELRADYCKLITDRLSQTQMQFDENGHCT
jgi:site-specific DNA-methyltransferase (adenine-specific)